MKARGPLFPSLGAETALADVQMRQTLALGLVPLGLVLLLFAAAAPDAPPWSVWVAGGLALGGLAVLAGMWRRAGRRYLRGYSTTHFLIRYLFVILCPSAVDCVRATILELGGLFPPLLLALLLLLSSGHILRAGWAITAVPGSHGLSGLPADPDGSAGCRAGGTADRRGSGCQPGYPTDQLRCCCSCSC